MNRQHLDDADNGGGGNRPNNSLKYVISADQQASRNTNEQYAWLIKHSKKCKEYVRPKTEHSDLGQFEATHKEYWPETPKGSETINEGDHSYGLDKGRTTQRSAEFLDLLGSRII